MPQIQMLAAGTKEIVINTILTPEQFIGINAEHSRVFILHSVDIDFATGFATVKLIPGNGFYELESGHNAD